MRLLICSFDKKYANKFELFTTPNFTAIVFIKNKCYVINVRTYIRKWNGG